MTQRGSAAPTRRLPCRGGLFAVGLTLVQGLLTGPSMAQGQEHELKRVLRDIDQVSFEAESTEILARYCFPPREPTKKPTRDRIYALQQRLKELHRRIAAIRDAFMVAGTTAAGTGYRSGFPRIDGSLPLTSQGAENNEYWGKAFRIAAEARRVIDQKRETLAAKPEVDCSQTAPPTVRLPEATSAGTGTPSPARAAQNGASGGHPFVAGRGPLEGLNPPGVSGEGYVVRLPQRFCSAAEKEAIQSRFDAADARARAKAAEWEAYARSVEARKVELMKGGLDEHWQRSLDHEANKARGIGKNHLGYVAANAAGRSLVASMPVVDCDEAFRNELRREGGRLGGGMETIPAPRTPEKRESILDSLDEVPAAPVRGRCTLPESGLEAPAGTLQGSPFSTTTKLSGRAIFGPEIGGIGTSAGLEAPPAEAGAGSFSTTTKLKAEVVWGFPASTCTGLGPGSQSPESPGNRSFTGRDPLETLINRIRMERGLNELLNLSPELFFRVQNEYIGRLAVPILKGAFCDHNLRLWEELFTSSQTYGLQPRSELLTCVRPKGGGWEAGVAEQWRISPIHSPILLKEADYLSCHRSQLGDKELGICITWRASKGAILPVAPDSLPVRSDMALCPSLLNRYLYQPNCLAP